MKKVVTFGEIMLRLAPPGYLRFSQTNSFDVIYGGGESNVAVSLANYGVPVRFVTRVPSNDIGQCALMEMRKRGVETDYMLRGGNRLGIYFLETGAVSRGSKVVYDRAHSMSVVCCVISSVIEGAGDGLKFSDRIVVPLGCSTIGTTRCTPKAFFREPEICLNFGTLNSANDRIRTKKAIRSVAMSAKVAIHGGAPTGGHLGHSSSGSSTSSSSSSTASFILVSPACRAQPRSDQAASASFS